MTYAAGSAPGHGGGAHGAGLGGGHAAAHPGGSQAVAWGHAGHWGRAAAPAGGRFGALAARYAPAGHYSGPRGPHFAGLAAAGTRGYRGNTWAGTWRGPAGYHPGWGWEGGYWHGAWWPGVWYGPGFAGFLPVLPLGCLTLWWGGIPYYFWHDVYYTWNPGYDGYVVTDPPPAEQNGSAADPEDAGYAAAGAGGAGGGSGSADVYLYPRNGQSEEQTATDRYECHRWAVGQSGFDPTRSQPGGSPSDYRRAIGACLDARGYSAR